MAWSDQTDDTQTWVVNNANGEMAIAGIAVAGLAIAGTGIAFSQVSDDSQDWTQQ